MKQVMSQTLDTDYDMKHGGEWNYQIWVRSPDGTTVKTYIYALNQIEARLMAIESACALLNSGQILEDLSNWEIYHWV